MDTGRIDSGALSVADEGQGAVPELLQLFRKRAGAGAGKTVGHGLNLAICKGRSAAASGRSARAAAAAAATYSPDA